MSENKKLFGFSMQEQQALFAKLNKNPNSKALVRSGACEVYKAPKAYVDFSQFPAFRQLEIESKVAEQAGIMNPFFLCHEGIAKATTRIDGQEYLNFSTYDYLDLNGHSEIEDAAVEAMRHWGTSASASRLVSGERPPHRALEKTIATLYGVEDAIVYVSGHATNVSTIGSLFGPQDIIFHDSLSHNSIVQGAMASRAERISFPHNDMKALERLLREHRPRAQRALIVTEGVFSMDGNIADLPELVKLKKAWGAFLMVDEAHALGVLGQHGRGSAEYFGIDPKEIDIWMGTLSKTCCGCGGYIAASSELIRLLKFTSPGFVYSVGMSPVLAAASRCALQIMQREPWRIAKLTQISQQFVQMAKQRGLNTGRAQGHAIVPIILGSSLLTGKVASRLFKRHVNVMPIIYPVVQEGEARLRFFLSAAHNTEHIEKALDILMQELPLAEQEVAKVAQTK